MHPDSREGWRRGRRATGGAPGFTLLELILVAAVLAIICALAIPAVLAARSAANEASAISTLRSLTMLNEQYKLRFGSYAGALGDLQAAGYVDERVGGGSKSGYSFVYSSSGESFVCAGNPLSAGLTGHRYFYVDSTAVIRFSTTGVATSADSGLDG